MIAAVDETGACLEGSKLECLVVVLDGDRVPDVRDGVEQGHMDEATTGQIVL